MAQRKTPRVRLTRPERREQLISAAQTSFRQKGIDRSSMKKLAVAAEVNIATLYQHFASTEELFTAALLEPLDESLEALLAAANERLADLHGEELLAELHRSLLAIMSELGATVNGILASHSKVSREHLFSAVWPRLTVWVQGVLDRSGPHRAGAMAPSMAPSLLGVYLWLAMHTNYRGEDLEAGWADRISDLLFAGLAGDSKP